MGTVSKALSLLENFTQSRHQIGLSEFARLSGMNKATVHRLLQALEAQGFVEKAGPDRAYRLGPEVLRLAALREAAVPLLAVARKTLADLAETTGETAHVSVLRGMQLNTLAHAYSGRHATRVMMEDAEVLSLHATGSGLAVLAYAPADFVAQVLNRPLPAFTDQTVTQPEGIRAALPAVRSTGVAESVGGFEAEVHSHAAPVFGPDRLPLGALAVAAPVGRMTHKQRDLIRGAVASAARDLTHRTGGICPEDYPRDDAA